jgi:metal transporter CNNM
MEVSHLRDLVTWAGIALCISQAALLSGLNLAIFSVSRLRLEVDAAGGDHNAERVLELRRDANATLSTVLWGNVAVNVLLTLLSDSVLAGVGAFLFSTVAITLLGEIAPQAYFARHAVRVTAALAPLLAVYRVLFYPVAKPTAMLLDRWIGPESVAFFRERDFRALIMKHVEGGGDVGHLEALGALNFLDLDDIPVANEGEPVDPRSVIELPSDDHGYPVLPRFERSPLDPFLRRLNASRKKWVIITDASGQPNVVLDAHHFLRDVLYDPAHADAKMHWHRPIVVSDVHARLGDVIGRWNVSAEHDGDDVVDNDLILLWGKQRRIITGADLLGRLLRGIVHAEAGA